jgi:hypothetical protein
MSHTALAPYLRPEFPVFKETPQSIGNVYSYRGPHATIAANKPAMYQMWADGRAVRNVELTPSIDNSGFSDLVIDTTVTFETAEVVATVLESERYQVRWMPHELPLLSHPEFSPGGGGSMDLSVKHTENGYERPYLTDVMGWEEETNLKLRDANKWSPIVNGFPSSTVYQATDRAVLYISLRKQGFTSYTHFAPVWTKVSVYNGTAAPGIDACGQKDDPPANSGFPVGYEWIKSGDNAERIGNQTKWQRTEEWTGFKKVWFDKDEVFFYENE